MYQHALPVRQFQTAGTFIFSSCTATKEEIMTVGETALVILYGRSKGVKLMKLDI